MAPHAIRKPLAPKLPSAVARIELSADQRVCVHDGGGPVENGMEASALLDSVPAQTRMIRTKQVKHACLCCDHSLKLEPAMAALIPCSLPTTQAQVWIVTTSYQDGLPLHKQAAILVRRRLIRTSIQRVPDRPHRAIRRFYFREQSTCP